VGIRVLLRLGSNFAFAESSTRLTTCQTVRLRDRSVASVAIQVLHDQIDDLLIFLVVTESYSLDTAHISAEAMELKIVLSSVSANDLIVSPTSSDCVAILEVVYGVHKVLYQFGRNLVNEGSRRRRRAEDVLVLELTHCT